MMIDWSMIDWYLTSTVLQAIAKGWNSYAAMRWRTKYASNISFKLGTEPGVQWDKRLTVTHSASVQWQVLVRKCLQHICFYVFYIFTIKGNHLGLLANIYGRPTWEFASCVMSSIVRWSNVIGYSLLLHPFIFCVLLYCLLYLTFWWR